jgi:hypothetical protein
MRKMRRARDTIPCPPPDDAEQASGKFPVVVFLRDRADEHVAPHYIGHVKEELALCLEDMRCHEHGCGPRAELTLSDDDDLALQVIHHGCCREFDRLVENAIRNSVVLAPMFRRVPA